MKVKDLIKTLSQYDQEAMVVISGYEDGLTEKLNIYETEIFLNVFEEWYYGEHSEHSFGIEESKYDKANAVVISR